MPGKRTDEARWPRGEGLPTLAGMARILPFVALMTPLGGGPGSGEGRLAEVRELLGRPDPEAELRRWRLGGRVLRDSRPALYVAEVYGEAGRLGGPPVRFLLCALAPESAPPLEQVAWRPRSSLVEPTVALAADDHGVLRGLLAEAAERGSVVWQGGWPGGPVAVKRLEPSGLSKRLQAVLAEAPLRPLGELEGGRPALAAVVPLSDPGLRLEPIHRAVRGLETFREETFLTLAAAYARLYEVDAPLTEPQGLAAARERMATLVRGYHAVLAVLPRGRGLILRFRQGLDLEHLKGAPRSPTLRSLDLALLDSLLLRTVLGIREPEAPGHPLVYAVEGLEALVQGVQEGRFQVGFGLNPPPLWEVRAVMEAAEVLPPHTLRVEPRPPMGLVFLDPEV